VFWNLQNRNRKKEFLNIELHHSAKYFAYCSLVPYELVYTRVRHTIPALMKVCRGIRCLDKTKGVVPRYSSLGLHQMGGNVRRLPFCLKVASLFEMIIRLFNSFNSAFILYPNAIFQLTLKYQIETQNTRYEVAFKKKFNPGVDAGIFSFNKGLFPVIYIKSASCKTAKSCTSELSNIQRSILNLQKHLEYWNRLAVYQ
jgi:hypothetical protein